MNKTNILVTSNDLINGESMPPTSLCSTYGGIDLSPSLKWTSVPSARSYALLCFDPDAGMTGKDTWIHWIISYISPQRNTLPSMTPIKTKYVILDNDFFVQGISSWGQYGWGGPCPGSTLPKITHGYHFVIYALDKIIHSEDYKTFLNDISGHIISQGHIIGTFSKK